MTGPASVEPREAGVMTPADVAAWLQINEKQVRALAARGVLPSWGLGPRLLRFHRPTLVAALNAKFARQVPEPVRLAVIAQSHEKTV
jgi:hypothetical protein